jgi:hypothetical protein
LPSAGDPPPIADAADGAPRIDAGADQVVPEGTAVRLNADLSGFEQRGVAVEWKQVSGPPVLLDHAATLHPTFTAPDAAADYELAFRVAAADGSASATDLVVVKVVADDDALTAAPARLVVGDAGSAVQLESTVTDPEHLDLSYLWVQVAGTPVEIPQPDARAPTVRLPEVFAEEELVFQVAVRSGDDQASQQVTVRVLPVDTTPRGGTVASAGSADPLAAAEDTAPGAARGIGRVWASLLAVATLGRRARL